MFEVDLIQCCGDLLSLALEEALGGGRVALVGPGTKKLRFLGWKPDCFEDPMGFSATKEYDIVACIQCQPQLNGVRLLNIDNTLYGTRGNELVRLTAAQLKEANAFMKKTGISLSRGESAVLPLELHSFLGKVESALRGGGTALFLDYGDPGIYSKLNKMKHETLPFSRFLATTNAGRMHVVNFNPYLSKSPHPIRNPEILAISKRIKLENKIVPWLDLEKKLNEGDKKIVEPFISQFFHVFSGWGEIIRDYKMAANELMRQLKDEDGIVQLYASSFVLRNTLPAEFSEKAWVRASEIARIPNGLPLFATKLQKVYKQAGV